uniref:Uncharacterized protein n=1 Tax=Arundo donax TaxID=35708 RepID=A0A0A8ZAE7_ARUDO
MMQEWPLSSLCPLCSTGSTVFPTFSCGLEISLILAGSK